MENQRKFSSIAQCELQNQQLLCNTIENVKEKASISKIEESIDNPSLGFVFGLKDVFYNIVGVIVKLKKAVDAVVEHMKKSDDAIQSLKEQLYKANERIAHLEQNEEFKKNTHEKKFHNKKAEEYFKEKGYNINDYNGHIPIRKKDIIKWDKEKRNRRPENVDN